MGPLPKLRGPPDDAATFDTGMTRRVEACITSLQPPNTYCGKAKRSLHLQRHVKSR